MEHLLDYFIYKGNKVIRFGLFITKEEQKVFDKVLTTIQDKLQNLKDSLNDIEAFKKLIQLNDEELKIFYGTIKDAEEHQGLKKEKSMDEMIFFKEFFIHTFQLDESTETISKFEIIDKNKKEA